MNKFCRDCTYFRNPELCTHPSHGFDLVTGTPIQLPARSLREAGNTCGMAGHLWSKRPEMSVVGE